ncbi:acyl-CoA dehydrogenase [Candidatus Symbiopectobacterium sp. 'North America']|uniref:acyl-CoA dehydrogenase n=1 Tax=Candidatus Symbiopectobacterium sp. 'North America' TaxID=2794574 RepID=UPI0018C90BBE|nr:acyl-CoA dehydrogenase [Candidatus Symbiopectobacterium sp. 'North America']MBG6246232.1 acyl-CoA dehydrogenase [Candidatus Symbiopectobacterium sp. 'North America']
MKKITIAFILIANLPLAHAGEYVKRNGVLSLSPRGAVAEFNINASHGDTSICEIYGEAISIGAEKGLHNQWVYSDKESTYAVVISEHKNGTIQVITDKCDNYCGVSAIGVIDGKYKKK